MQVPDKIALKASLLALLIVCLGPSVINAQLSPLFLSQEVLELDIYADMETVLTDIGEERAYHNALIIYNENEKEIRLDAELKSRGHFRRKEEICSFPPYKVNFKKEQIKGGLFEHADKIKLVTHCNTEDREGNENVLTEYLIYCIYNQFTDTSLKVRLCKITWHDILDNYRPVTRYGFFVEKIEKLAERHHMKEIEKKAIAPEQLHMPTYHLFAIFQFLIGNTDWSVLLPQNIKLVGKDDDSMLIPVPYDFDLCQLVSPSYATKKYGFDLENLEPEIKAYCESLDDFNPAIEVYLKKKSLIIALIENFSLLSKKEKRKLVQFLEDRYSLLSDRESLQQVFTNYCK